ncbi:MAG: bacterio-opsin activator domain-containing protein [Salinirussus sp.]
MKDGRLRLATEAALDAETRPAIESSVCETLAEGDQVQAACISRVDPVADRLRIKAASGLDIDVEDHALSLDSEHAPAMTARTGEVRLSDEETPFADRLRNGGVADVAACVPVVEGERIGAVLVIYSADASGIEGNDRSRLAHFGLVLGHAIVTTERERVLTQDRLIELTLRIRGLFGGAVPADAVPDLVLDEFVRLDDGRYEAYGEVPTTDFERLTGLIDQYPPLKTVSRVGEREDGVDVRVELEETRILSTVHGAGGVVDRVELDYPHIRVHHLLPTTADARRVVAATREAYPETNVLGKRNVTRPTRRIGGQLSELTERQREVLRAAYFGGFYDRPRSSDGGEIADRLGISTATFSEHRRAAERKLLASVFADNLDQNQ